MSIQPILVLLPILSVDKKKIVLESKDGDDIMMSQFSSTSPPLNVKH